MAKIYGIPKELGEAPSFSIEQPFEAYQQATEKFVQSVKDWAKKNGNGECRGEEIRFPVADGYAQYVVVGLKPVTLIHLPIGDGWQFQYANRLTAKDVRDQVRREQAMAKMFAKQ
jgi:hypothetical protein